MHEVCLILMCLQPYINLPLCVYLTVCCLPSLGFPSSAWFCCLLSVCVSPFKGSNERTAFLPARNLLVICHRHNAMVCSYYSIMNEVRLTVLMRLKFPFLKTKEWAQEDWRAVFFGSFTLILKCCRSWRLHNIYLTLCAYFLTVAVIFLDWSREHHSQRRPTPRGS